MIVKGNSYTEYVGQAASFLQHKQARAMAGTFVWIPTSQVVPTGAFKNGRPCVHSQSLLPTAQRLYPGRIFVSCCILLCVCGVDWRHCSSNGCLYRGCQSVRVLRKKKGNKITGVIENIVLQLGAKAGWPIIASFILGLGSWYFD